MKKIYLILLCAFWVVRLTSTEKKEVPSRHVKRAHPSLRATRFGEQLATALSGTIIPKNCCNNIANLAARFHDEGNDVSKVEQLQRIYTNTIPAVRSALLEVFKQNNLDNKVLFFKATDLDPEEIVTLASDLKTLCKPITP